MARKTALNPDGTGFQVGADVRVERGFPVNGDGVVEPGAEPIWIIYRKRDVTDDPDTTYDYRYEQAATFPEEEPGICPAKAMDRAQALAGEE